MKLLYCFLSIFLCISCSPKTSNFSSNSAVENSIDFDWLIGDWKRTNDEPGNRTFEIWDKKSNDLYQGNGWTMKGTDTLSQEVMQIIKQDQKWILKVSGTGFEPVVFDCIGTSKNSFEFANEANDFPKFIEYNYDGKHINAQISGGGATIPFSFEKIVLRR